MIWVILAVFAALQAADYWTTDRILRQGGNELNPVLRWFFERFGRRPALLAGKLVAVAAAGWLAMSGSMWPLVAVTAVYGAVVAHNARSLARQKAGGGDAR